MTDDSGNRRPGRVLLAAGVLLAAVVLCFVSWRMVAGKSLVFCPQFRLTGLYCPGCGTMRALQCLLRGNLCRAFAYNPLTALLMPVIAVLGLWWLAGYVRTGGDVILYRVPAWLYAAVLGALFLFGILRNVPLGAFDALRPPV